MDRLNGNELNLSDKEMEILKENVKREYCRKMGWNADSLTPEQLLEIVSSKEYKNPSLIKS